MLAEALAREQAVLTETVAKRRQFVEGEPERGKRLDVVGGCRRRGPDPSVQIRPRLGEPSTNWGDRALSEADVRNGSIAIPRRDR